MTVSVWSTFTFAIRNTIRPVTLGFVGLQVGIALVMTWWAHSQIPQLMKLKNAAAWQSYALQTNILVIALGLLVLPLVVFLISHLSAQVFGRPLPVTWWQGCLRALKAAGIGFLGLFALSAVLMIPIVLLNLLLMLLLQRLDPIILPLSYVIPMLVMFWIIYIHIFYGYGVMFKGRFSFRQARAYSRGRRARLFGGLALLALIAAPIQLLLMPDLNNLRLVETYGMALIRSAVAGILVVPFQLLVLGHFFEAMDEADARAADNTAPEFAPTGIEG